MTRAPDRAVWRVSGEGNLWVVQRRPTDIALFEPYGHASTLAEALAMIREAVQREDAKVILYYDAKGERI